MSIDIIKRHFRKMGARVAIAPSENRGRFNREPVGVVLDIQRDNAGEYFDLRFDPKVVDVRVIDVQPKERHLLLMSQRHTESQKDKFLCGHDERAWFVAAVPDARGVSNVRTAMEALKPPAVREMQSRKGVKFKDRKRRKTAAYVRQGEWFFIPAPDFVPEPAKVLKNEPMRRGAGKPHIAAELTRANGETVYVCQARPNGVSPKHYRELLQRLSRAKKWNWRVMKRNATVYVRGSIRHPDHATIGFDCWHEVHMNTETQSRAMRNVAFLD